MTFSEYIKMPVLGSGAYVDKAGKDIAEMIIENFQEDQFVAVLNAAAKNLGKELQVRNEKGLEVLKKRRKIIQTLSK